MGQCERRKEIRFLLYSGRGETRAELADVVGQLGFHRVARLYIHTTFGVGALDELDDRELARALRFVERLDRVSRQQV
jgi:hypothetical protein